MDKRNINGDTKIVMGSPVPTEDSIDIPPKTAGQKIIEAGEIELSLEPNTKELVNEVNKKYGKEDKEH